MRRTYRQDPVTREFYEIGREMDHQRSIVRGFEPYLSPVDGSVIRNRSDLKEHEKRTGQTNDLDHLREQTQREVAGRKVGSPGTIEERKQAIRDACERVRSSGFSRRTMYDE